MLGAIHLHIGGPRNFFALIDAGSLEGDQWTFITGADTSATVLIFPLPEPNDDRCPAHIESSGNLSSTQTFATAAALPITVHAGNRMRSNMEKHGHAGVLFLRTEGQSPYAVPACRAKRRAGASLPGVCRAQDIDRLPLRSLVATSPSIPVARSSQEEGTGTGEGEEEVAIAPVKE